MVELFRFRIDAVIRVRVEGIDYICYSPNAVVEWSCFVSVLNVNVQLPNFVSQGFQTSTFPQH